MNILVKVTFFCACLIGLVGCSGSDGGANSQGAQGAQSVEAGPLSCLLQSDSAGSRLASVTCEVGIGNAQASLEGIDTSVTNILQVIVLPDVCPSYSKTEVFADSHDFTQEVHAQLSAAYVKSGIGWSVESVSCQVAEYSAP